MVRYVLRFFELQLEFLDFLFLIVQLFHQLLYFIVSMFFCVLSFLFGVLNSGFVTLQCRFDGCCKFTGGFFYTLIKDKLFRI